MANEIDGMRVVISADASQAIRTLQDFHNKFKNIANSINATVINANVSMTDFTNSVQDMGSLASLAQMEKMRISMKEMNKSIIQSKNNMGMANNPAAIIALTEHLKKQNTVQQKNKKSWLAIGIASAAALYGIIRMSSLAQMWVSELSQTFTYFLDTALSPLSPIIEGLLSIFWQLTDWFSGLDPIIQGAVGALGLLGIAFGAVVGFISWLTGATGLSVITGAFSYIAGAIAGIAAIIGLPVEAVIVIIVALGVALYVLWKKHDEIIAYLGAGWDWLKTKISDIWTGITTYLGGVWEGLKNTVSTAWDYIKSAIVGAIQGAYDTIVKIVDKIKNAITSVPGVQTAINIIQGGYQTAKSYLGYAQGTDYVPQTGIYKLHEGEKVIPKGENSTNSQSVVYNNTFTINNPVMKSDSDIRQLAAQLSNFWKDDMQRFTRGVV